MQSKFLEELSWRGMLQEATPFTKKNFGHEPCAGYIGFDPTAKSLHIGNLAAIMLLKNLQLSGHKPVVLMGGFTGMIGDPAGKSAERKFLEEAALQENLAALQTQFAKFLDFDCGDLSAEIVNNYEWLSQLSLPSFFRDVGKHVSVNRMLTRESVKKRLDGDSGISYTEFSYQIFQAYDFYWLYKNRNCKLQMGGSDQWGNIMGGVDFIRRMLGAPAYAVTCPLLEKSDGNKFGKTEEGNVWLDPEMTNPYKFYQFWVNTDDRIVGQLFRTFTLLGRDEIEELERVNVNNPIALKKRLAEDLTTRVHSKSEALRAVQASDLLFGKSTIRDLEACDQQTVDYVFSDIPTTEISRGEYASKSLVDLVSEAFTISRSEVRRLIRSNGLAINKESVSGQHQLTASRLLRNRYLLLQTGKNYSLVTVVN